jgi:hypothetical protein
MHGGRDLDGSHPNDTANSFFFSCVASALYAIVAATSGVMSDRECFRDHAHASASVL